MMNFRNKSANTFRFSMVPQPDVPRSSFDMPRSHKTTFDAGLLIPVMCEEVLPGDSWSVNMTTFVRLATPIFPLMDNLYLDSFFFFVPNRLVWDNWVRFMGEQDNPTDSISFVVPTMSSPAGGFAVGTIYDHFGLPTTGVLNPANSKFINTLPLRGYNLIWNEWFRDQNLQTAAPERRGDTGDLNADYVLRRRGKRADYFTSCLPWPQKGGLAVSLPLGTSAPIRSTGLNISVRGVAGAPTTLSTAGAAGASITNTTTTTSGILNFGASDTQVSSLYADLAGATAATVNQLRQAFQVQKLLERDARGGTRYTELVRSHFGVQSPDARLQRPEYLGGGTTAVVLNPVAQTSGTGATGQTTPLGNLAAVGTALGTHRFSGAFTEHGHIIGLVCVRADLNYQQGLRKLWSRSTRYDYYFPAFAYLGEQAVLQQEIYVRGDGGDATVFGYQERWAEYRFSPSMITGLFKSTSAGTLDAWHLAQRFTVAPVLGATFIEENPPVSRVLAVGAAANGAQFILDAFFRQRAVRPLPMYSVPGLIDHL